MPWRWRCDLLLLIVVVIIIIIIIIIIVIITMGLVRDRTIPTERPPLVGEVGANFCG
jgi:hypothetical protein